MLSRLSLAALCLFLGLTPLSAMPEKVPMTERASSGVGMHHGTTEDVPLGGDIQVEDGIKLAHATAVIEHRRNGIVIWSEVSKPNVITNAGRDYLHTQGYGTGATSTAFSYIALSNDTVSETGSSTVLSNEIVANGLSRAQATTITHTTGTNTTTLAKTFTCATAPQAAQKAALFTASSSGTMNHVLAFTQRSLQIGDTLTITFTITLGALDFHMVFLRGLDSPAANEDLQQDMAA